jgi:uncharacterized SAM-binding protein YcdF (DUF218 family)
MKKPLHLYFILSLLIISVHSCMFVGRTSDMLYTKAQTRAPFDAIIVPGVPYDTSSAEWTDIMRSRVYWAYYLYKNGMAKNIIFSGAAVYTPYVESEIMGMYAEALGIPGEHIFFERKAEHSAENIYYSYYTGKRLGFKRMAVATDPFQSRFLRRYPKRLKLELIFIPIMYDYLKLMKPIKLTIDAEKARVKNFVSLMKRQNRWKRIQGSRGKNLKRVKADPDYRKP